MTVERLSIADLCAAVRDMLIKDQAKGKLTLRERGALVALSRELGRRAHGAMGNGGPYLVCPHCADVIRSCHRHDMDTCVCGKSSVDGGGDYTKVSFSEMPPTPLHPPKPKRNRKAQP